MMRYYTQFPVLLCKVLALWLVSTSSHAEVHSRAFMLDEPVFGGQAYVVEAGDQQKPMIMFVHGLGDRAADTWKQFIPSLSRDFFVISFDLPGFGRSSKGNHLYSPDNYVKFIRFIASRYRHKSFVLVGHSMGGNVALRYATVYPQQVNRLMLIDAAGILHRLAYVQFLNYYGIRVLPQFYPEQKQDLEAVSDFLLGPLGEYTDLFSLGEQLLLTEPVLRQNLLGGEPNAISAYAMIMMDYSELLEKMKVPTLILWGGQDMVTPLRTGKVLAATLPEAGLVVFEAAGHSPMNQEPQRFMQFFRRFAIPGRDELHAMLQQYRYSQDSAGERIAEKIIDCRGGEVKSLQGRFDKLVIRSCSKLVLAGIDAQDVRIFDSQVQMENCQLKGKTAALSVVDSDVSITACRIIGSPAIRLVNANLDVAGSQLESNTSVLKNELGQSDINRTHRQNRLLFSVTRMKSEYMEKYLHGPVHLKSGEEL